MFITHPAEGKVPGSPRNGELVFFGPSLQGQEVLLPVGKDEARYFINVVVLIKDAFGEFSKITLPVQVLLSFWRKAIKLSSEVIQGVP